MAASAHPGLRIAVVGGGWAGIAAAVEGTRRGHAVSLFEMAPQLGGRARSVSIDGQMLDNGQHILIGAYTATLALMRTLAVDREASLLRSPLRLIDPEGHGLRLRDGPPAVSFAAAVLRHPTWRLAERLALLRTAAGWRLRGFRCDAATSVAQLTAGLPCRVRAELIEPLCIAALNTPAEGASAEVFLRVLRDALFAGPGSADLLLPRVGLSALLPDAALAWLTQRGATVQLPRRVEKLRADGDAWQLDGEPFDGVVLATTPMESARLTAELAPAWSASAAALRFEPIVTVYLRSSGTRLSAPMLLLHSDDAAPAQFVFDRGQLGGSDGLLAFVISGAARWVERGLASTTEAVLAQARSALGSQLRGPLRVVHAIAEKRATFSCTPGLRRPVATIAARLVAAGDFIAGPYPATLEGAVRSGATAIALLASS